MKGSSGQREDRERIVREALGAAQPRSLLPGTSCREEEVAVEEKQSLRPEFSATLAPHLHHALSSLPRRQILRALAATTDAQTLEDLGGVVAAINIKTLRYHVQVLEKAGCLSQYSHVVLADRMLPAYASNVRDSQMVVDFLRATKREDDQLKG